MTNEAYDNSTILDPRIAERLKRDDKGLVAAVIQQFDTKEVLMVGYMNDEAIRRTLMTGRVLVEVQAGVLAQGRHFRTCPVCEVLRTGLRWGCHSG